MASMDFVYDLLDKVQEQKTEYLFIALQKGKEQYKVDVFYQVDNEEAATAMLAVLDNVRDAIENGEDDGEENGEEETFDDEEEPP